MDVYPLARQDTSGVIRDSRAQGYPTRYASRGFEELFGYGADECAEAGQSCGALVGGACLLGKGASALKQAASIAGLSEIEAAAGIQLMTDTAGQALRAAADADEHPGATPLLLMNRRKNGELFVCEMAVWRNRHPTLGWSNYAGAQRDVTEEVPVAQLLKAAAQGVEQYDALCQSWRSCNKRTCLAKELGSPAATLSPSSEQMWKGDLTKAPLHHVHLGAFVVAEAPEKPQPALGGERLLDLLEGVEGEDEPTEEAPAIPARVSIAEFDLFDVSSCSHSEEFKSIPDTASEAGSLSASEKRELLQAAVDKVHRQSLRCLAAPMALAVRIGATFPVLVCSRGFEELTAITYAKTIGEDLRSLLGIVQPQLLRKWRSFCYAVLADETFRPGCGFAVLACGSSVRLPEGEFSFATDFIGRSGKLCKRLVYLKQVELDDEHFVIALQAPMTADSSSPFKIEDTFNSLSNTLDEVIEVLGSEFMYSGSMRRQLPCRHQGEGDRVLDMLMQTEM
eukprot:gb/GFBE01021110.1/.p1 GENE.gb/GFBE01021110.1/~~gb/GFBE01021110.1/.p1  ORF type:complete len:509 (+),score=84.25 gb/GFBE01021110.1/:1-1527(+)